MTLHYVCIKRAEVEKVPSMSGLLVMVVVKGITVIVMDTQTASSPSRSAVPPNKGSHPGTQRNAPPH